MSKFYNRYKNYFLSEQSSPHLHNSYLTPYLSEMKNRAQELQLMDISPLKYKLKTSTNIFSQQVIPKLAQLNRQIDRHKASFLRSPVKYFQKDPKQYNKNNKLQIYGEVKPNTKQEVANFGNFHEGSFGNNRIEKCLKTVQYAYNPEKEESLPLLTKIRAKNSIPKQKLQMVTKNDEIQQSKKMQRNLSQVISSKPTKIHKYFTQSFDDTNKIYHPNITDIRKDYGYPQLNSKLMDQQYNKKNQYKFINKKLHDIKWLEKYYPRYEINTIYRIALMRRNQGKKNIGKRRSRLKQLFQEENKKIVQLG